LAGTLREAVRVASERMEGPIAFASRKDARLREPAEDTLRARRVPPEPARSVFVSYAWGGESERLVNELEARFKKRGMPLVRDKSILGYKDDIEEFEDLLASGHCVVLILSDRYLKSDHCMRELLGVAAQRSFRARIFPVVLPDADIYRPIRRVHYIEHWREKKRELNDAIRDKDLSTYPELTKDVRFYDDILKAMDELIATFRSMNVLTPELHEQTDFEALANAVQQRLREGHKPAFDAPTSL
jgi:hypothetical protein